MTTLLYLTDSYLKEFDAVVTGVKEGKYITLDKTAFYPFSGGQANDTGTITTTDGRTAKITNVRKADGDIIHEIEPTNTVKEGDNLHCIINWQRRSRLMRMHTAAHLISAMMYNEAKIMITGNELQPEQSRIDFSFDQMDQEVMRSYIQKANDAIKKSIPVKTYFLPREEAMKIPGIIKLANALPPTIKEFRIVEIEGIDIEADGGTHVNNLSEIGEIVFLKTENKGKGRKRMYYTLK